MYDPRRTNPIYFPELDDPRLWAEVAARSGVPPMQYQNPPEEIFYVLPSSPDYRVEFPNGPDAPVVESWLVPLSDQSPTPAVGQSTPGVVAEHSPSTRSTLGGMGPTIIWIIAILLIAPLFSNVVMSSKAPATPAGPPNTGYSLYGNPSITGPFIDKVLDHYGSPAAGEGQTLYDLGVKYKVDPAFPLGFFMKESTFGTAGIARYTLSLSNMRCVPRYACFHDPVNGYYASFPDWQTGFEAWYILLTGPVYKGSGLTTIDQITQRYAPSQDHNDPSSYACFVKYAADTWRSGIVEVGAPPRSYCESKVLAGGSLIGQVHACRLVPVQGLDARHEPVQKGSGAHNSIVQHCIEEEERRISHARSE